VLLTDGRGVCGASTNASCKCSVRSECQSVFGSNVACAPYAENDVITIKAHVCVPNDDLPYHGCYTGRCDSTHDCMADALGNQYCTRLGCSTDAFCGPAGIGRCDTSAVCKNDFSGCAGGQCTTAP
jgi:hypothetical protein